VVDPHKQVAAAGLSSLCQNITVFWDCSAGSPGGHAKCATSLDGSIRSREQPALAAEMGLQALVLLQLGAEYILKCLPVSGVKSLHVGFEGR